MKQRERISAQTWSFRVLAWTMLICLLVTCLPVPGLAAENIQKVSGKVYTFPDDNDYDISSATGYKMSNAGGKTYGTFTVHGDLGKAETHNGVPAFKVMGGLPQFFYTYTDTLLKAQNPDPHLYSDSGKELAGMKLDSDIKNGALILQTSMDRKNWVAMYSKTNVFEEVPVHKDSFAEARDIEILNGCYYRVLVAYETRILKKSTDLLVADWNSYDYTKHAEVYEFYLYSDETNQKPVSSNRHQLGELVRTAEFDGYWGKQDITVKDPHYGWDLGHFFMSGKPIKDGEEKPMFLKKEGDQLVLWFHLDQDLNALDGNPHLYISSDEDNWDSEFQTKRIRFGHGTLIIQYTDHENITHDPQIYTDYLAANTSVGADTRVQLFEEGDYKVALDYEICSDKMVDKRYHYRIAFEFSVRNSNCMAFLFDIGNGAELHNNAITRNGFRIDMANSHYLDVYVKREIMTQSANGLTEDVRCNHLAEDGKSYAMDGIYTVTVKNRYTNQETQKRIYVGSDPLMKAHMQTGKSIPVLKELVAEGAMIDEMGNIIMPAVETTAATVPATVPTPETAPETAAPTEAPVATEAATVPAEEPSEEGSNSVIWITAAAVVILAAVIFFALKHRRHAK